MKPHFLKHVVADTSNRARRAAARFGVSLCLLAAVPALAEPLQVMASIKPLALMVEAVAGEHAQVRTLVKPGQTPHDFAFKVSDRQSLAKAGLLVWVGSDLEPYLTSLAKNRQAISMAHVLEDQLPEAHPLASAEDDHSHADQHFWLNPLYGAAMIKAIAEQLADLDPEHQQDYQQNAEQVIDQLSSLTGGDLREGARVNETRQYAVVHRAYDYFLAYFAYPQPLVLTPVPEISPGARQLWRVSQQLESGDCLLVDSNSPAKWVLIFSERNELDLKEVDIMGYNEKVKTYQQLLRGVKEVFDHCVR